MGDRTINGTVHPYLMSGFVPAVVPDRASERSSLSRALCSGYTHAAIKLPTCVVCAHI